jgi:hypothetical protein
LGRQQWWHLHVESGLSAPASNPVEMQKFETEGETAYLAHKHTEAVRFVRHDPLLFAGVSVRRAVRFWRILELPAELSAIRAAGDA